MADEWFYELNGNNHGPVSFEAIKKCRTEGDLNASSLIWKTGSESWRPLHEWTEFQDLDSVPPPKPIKHITVNSSIIGVLLTAPILEFIFVPFISSFIVAFMADSADQGFISKIFSEVSDMYRYEEIANHWLWLVVYIVIYSIFCSKDEEHLDKSLGADSDSATSAWAKYVVPVYVFHRAQRILRYYPKANWLDAHWVTILFILSIFMSNQTDI